MTAPMIGIPEGTRVYGMQLPIQAQSLMIAADWERDAGVEELAPAQMAGGAVVLVALGAILRRQRAERALAAEAALTGDLLDE